MLRWWIFLLMPLLGACAATVRLPAPKRSPGMLTGSGFYDSVAAASRDFRENLAVNELLHGDIPDFLRCMVRIRTELIRSDGRRIRASYFVTPDYVSLGSNDDWARLPLTPMAAQRLADSFHCFLPTRKMVDDIYRAARVKLRPVPMYAFRDSAVTFWQHHLIIEGQRKGREGLIAGIKKDVVITGRLYHEARPDRVAIYGWHLPGGKPIQPLYTGHINWYVDYSHGIRLVYDKIRVNGRWVNYADVLANPEWKGLLCDEPDCDCTRYRFP